MSASNDRQPNFPLVAKIINGGIAGMVGVASLFPIDLAKTRLQNQTVGNEVYKSIFDCLKKVIKAEGYFGLYRGSAVNLLLITPEKAIKLTGNDFFRHLLSTEHNKHSSSGQGKSKKAHLTLPREILAGGGAGLCQIIVTTPMELLKIGGQQGTSSQSEQRPSAMRTALSIVRKRGILGLYQNGFTSTMLRDVSFSVVYFPLFAHLSMLGHTLMLDKKQDEVDDANSLFWVNFLAGCTAAGISSVVVNPADVVKTRLQLINLGSSDAQKYTGIRNAFVEIYRNEGLGAFMKGASARVMYIAPLFGIAQTVYFLGIGEKILQKLS
uniref:Mitochondrial glutamate carrier 1 n=1 Tax=Aceria tosichella TaxID=561515 RepID=A0A6G1SCV6_9ACAR